MTEETLKITHFRPGLILLEELQICYRVNQASN